MQRVKFDLWERQAYLHSCYYFYTIGAFAVSFLQLRFSLKYYSSGTGCVFEPVSFDVKLGSNHWKKQILNTTQNVRS